MGERSFAARVIAWQREHGRHQLPWQNTHDPYKIWLSEIMLQQTQVAAVIPYYLRFLERFPTIGVLARAPSDSVMQRWAGLGYYARARNLQRAAQSVMDRHAGVFPQLPNEIATLPGVGLSTANAIAAFAFGANVPILDGNVKRVLARHGGVEGFPGTPEVASRLWKLAEAVQPKKPRHDDVIRYTQGVMDLGALVCTRRAPRCSHCPVSGDCVALRAGRTDEIPAARPSRRLPLREMVVLLVCDSDRVLVELRPSVGIWGGLLSLPEVAIAQKKWASKTLQVPTAQLLAQKLPSFVHSFTHFQLTITPMSIVTRTKVEVTTLVSPFRWLHRNDIDTAALPAPIKRLLLRYFK